MGDIAIHLFFYLASSIIIRLAPEILFRSCAAAAAPKPCSSSLRGRASIWKEIKIAPSGAIWLEYLRRHAAIITLEDVHAAQQQQSEQSQSTRKQLSAMIAFALCFLASASSSTTGSSSSTTSSTTTSSNQERPKFTPGGDGGGGGGKLKSTKTKPMFLFSKLQAEKDVQQVQKDATENPYLVSEGIFQGARWTMEDTYKIENGGRFVAVFDGHGGAEVSTVLQERLHELYMEELAKKHWEQQNDFGVERKEIPSKSSHIAALQRGLEQVEDAIMKLDDLVYQGSTAVCVVLHVAKDGKRTLLTANVGDSRAILCRDGKAVDMTRDHKPGDEIERKRIEAMGEEVEWDPYGQVYRVRDLSLSRAIGDRFAKPVVTSEAEIMTFPVSERDDQFVLLASDGLWDVMSSQEVVDYVQEVLTTESQVFSRLDKRKEMARIVANEALERGSADNVCVLVLWLKKE